MYFNQNVRMNGKEGITDLVRGDDPCLPYMKKMPSFFKKVLKFLRNIPSFFENLKVFLHTPNYIRWHKPAHIYT